MKVSLTGAVQLELLAEYFREAGFELAAPGEIADVTFDVTAHDRVLTEEVKNFRDKRFERLAGCPYSREGIAAIVDEFRWFLKRGEKKVLAVDADNTLWRGILSEDGKDRLCPFVDFQSALRQLAAEGVVIVVLSKNDPGSINLDFATLHKVNWEPKAGNLLEACKELKLSPEAVVFLDDNAYEQAQMQAHLPCVTVAPWDGIMNERQLARRLKEYFFSGAGKTEEDRLRNADYRRRLEQGEVGAATSKAEYLQTLGLYVEPRRAETRDLDRLFQMAGKTNQFNATTLRRSREEFLERLENTFVFRAGDRFGEMGIVAYVIYEPTTKRLTDFVMSCRAMGRTLEYFVYAWVTRQLGFAPAIDYQPTAKNSPFKAFLDTLTHGEMPASYFQEV